MRPMDDELLLAPAHRLAAAVRDKEVSSRELLDGYLARIERRNPAINSVVTLDVERSTAAGFSTPASRSARPCRSGSRRKTVTPAPSCPLIAFRAWGT